MPGVTHRSHCRRRSGREANCWLPRLLSVVATLTMLAACSVPVDGGEVKVLLCGKQPNTANDRDRSKDSRRAGSGKVCKAGSATALQSVEFCLGCPDPHLEGSKVEALQAVYGPSEFLVTGVLQYAVPNDMAGKKLINKRDLKGHVALVDRGQVPLVDKVLLAQRAGAVGVVIADDGSCSGEFECGRVGSAAMGGFSGRDPPQSWRDVKIPAVLVMSDVADRLRRLMDIERLKIPGMGEHWVQARAKR